MIHTQHTIIKDFFTFQMDDTRIRFGCVCDSLFGISAVRLALDPGSKTFTAAEAYLILDLMMTLAVPYSSYAAAWPQNTVPPNEQRRKSIETEKGVTA